MKSVDICFQIHDQIWCLLKKNYHWWFTKQIPVFLHNEYQVWSMTRPSSSTKSWIIDKITNKNNEIFHISCKWTHTFTSIEIDNISMALCKTAVTPVR